MNKQRLGILSLAALLLWVSSATAAPRMTIEETKFDFGFVPQQAKVAHVFWLKSTGDDSLIITKIVPGCGCTKAPLDNSRLGPGDSTRLEIVFSTRNYRSRVVKTPRIETNEGPPYRTVEIITHVVTQPGSTYPLSVDPPILEINQASGPSAVYRLQFTNRSDEDLDLTLVSQPNQFFDVVLPNQIKAGETAEATLVPNQKRISASYEKSFTVEVLGSDTMRFTVPVRCNVRSYGKK